MTREPIFEKLPQAFRLLLLFYVVYGGADMVGRIRGPVEMPRLSIEQSLPFVPEAAVVYLSLSPLMLLSLVLFPTRRSLQPLFTVLALEIVIAGCVFLLYPTTVTGPELDVVDATSGFYALADALALSCNAFPSLHVAFAITTACAYRRILSRWVAAATSLWALAITGSTLLLRQHVLLDVFGALALALLAERLASALQMREPSDALLVPAETHPEPMNG